jgi:hypothetical protein
MTLFRAEHRTTFSVLSGPAVLQLSVLVRAGQDKTAGPPCPVLSSDANIASRISETKKENSFSDFLDAFSFE